MRHRFLALFLLAFVLEGGNNRAIADTWSTPSLPIQIASEQRFFRDATGNPFLLIGDTAWSLIAELKRKEVEIYLRDRKARGFNAILVNLIEHEFSSNPPANAYGAKPFTGNTFGPLNTAYFDHAAWVIERAQAMGLLVLLAPAYLGVNGSSQGWYAEAETAGPKVMRTYGEAIARHFSKFHNIVWVLGGDFDAPDKLLVSSLAEGITRVTPGALQTIHSSRNTPTAEYWKEARWLSFDTVYDYDNVHGTILSRTESQTMPVVLLEGLYEDERGTDAQALRMNAYGALLAGAAGQVFGNNPIWHFSGPGVFSAENIWQEALNSPGSRSMTYLRILFDMIPWTELRPDRNHTIALHDKTFAAFLPDRSLIVLYGNMANGNDSFTIRKEALTSIGEANWFDPASGKMFKARTPKQGEATTRFEPPSTRNAGEDSDWILLIGHTKGVDPDRKP